uniref:BHLH domain-containing protein n=1 Tax=Trichuris muris TaxID=70415 RepID=A0A5S6QEA2_TRIMR
MSAKSCGISCQIGLRWLGFALSPWNPGSMTPSFVSEAGGALPPAATFPEGAIVQSNSAFGTSGHSINCKPVPATVSYQGFGQPLSTVQLLVPQLAAGSYAAPSVKALSECSQVPHSHPILLSTSELVTTSAKSVMIGESDSRAPVRCCTTWAGIPSVTDVGSQGQYVVLFPHAEVLNSPRDSSAAVAPVAPAQLQQATFIPLPALDPLPSSRVLRSLGTNTDREQTDSGHQCNNVESIGQPTENKDVRRRAFHNQVERRRRDTINAQIAKIAKILPPARGVAGRQTESIGKTLSRAVEYIEELKSHVRPVMDFAQLENKMKAEVAAMQTRIDQLKVENENIIHLLRAKGISVPPQ